MYSSGYSSYSSPLRHFGPIDHMYPGTPPGQMGCVPNSGSYFASHPPRARTASPSPVMSPHRVMYAPPSLWNQPDLHHAASLTPTEIQKITPGKPRPVYNYNQFQVYDVEPHVIQEEIIEPTMHHYTPPRVQRRAPPPSPPTSVQKVGVGLQLEVDNDQDDVIVTYIVPGFAAWKCVLFSCFDKVVSINGQHVAGMDLSEIKKLTIGNEGTVCTMVMRRGHDDGRYVARLVRKVPDTFDRSNEDCVQAVLKFEAADTNNDGYLSYSEVRASLPSWSEHEVRRYFNKMDNDGDGRISTKEYDDFWAKTNY